MTDQFASLTATTSADWDRWLSRNVDITEAGVTLAKTPAVTPSSLGFTARDIDLNPNGNLVALTTQGDVNVYVREQDALKSLTLTGYDDVGFENPALIGSTSDELYVIDGDNGRIGAFSRRLRRLEWTTDGATDPVAAVGSTHRVYLLDRGSGRGSGFVRTLEPGEQSDIVFETLQSPIDITVDTNETVYILDDSPDGPVLLRSAAHVGRFVDTLSPVGLSLPDGFTPQSIGAQTAGELVCYGTNGDGEPTLLRYDIERETVTTHSALTGAWTGLLSGTTGSAGDEQIVYLRSVDDGAVWAFDEGRENQKDPEITRYEGRLIGRFDSGSRDTQWHRATLDVEKTAPGNRVDIQYYASECETDGIDDFSAITAISEDQKTELRASHVDGLWDLIQYTPETLSNVVSDVSTQEATAWLETARQVLETEFEQRSDAHEVTDPSDTLLTEATGRYLHVLVRFVGSRTQSPRLRSLTAYCPRQSYLRYLPEIYKQTGRNSAFLERFLSIFETTFVDIESSMEQTTQYLDSQEIPKEYLSWLNGWLALDIGHTWSEAARRELLARAPELYKMRGTKQGMEELITLYLDHVTLPEPPWSRSRVRIERQLDRLVDRGFLSREEADERLELYDDRASQGYADEILISEYEELHCITDPEKKEQYRRLFGHPRRFQVLLQPTLPDKHVSAIKDIVASEKPVYTDARAEKLQRRFQIDDNTYLGINTYLPKRHFEIGHSALGTQTQLGQ